jgi:hypothetical protein
LKNLSKIQQAALKGRPLQMTCPTLETSRLWLKPLELADAPQIQAIFPQWEIVKHLNAKVPWPYPPDGALIFVRDISLPAMEQGEEWLWTLRLKSAPENLIGLISLEKSEHENRGFWIDPKWQRQGLMSEASEVVTDYWFEVLGFPFCARPRPERMKLRGASRNAKACASSGAATATTSRGACPPTSGKLRPRNGGCEN